MHTLAEPTCPLAERVSQLTERLRALWWDCPTDAFPDSIVPDPAACGLREAALERLVAQAISATTARVTNAEEQLALQQHSMAAFTAFAHEALGFEAQQLAMLERGFMPALAAFATAARRFDPTLSGADIFQAGRNVSILNSLQLMLGLPVALTPSVTAYSLLYPYTDNYLDDPGIPLASKAAFNSRLRRRLQGEAVQPTNAHEQTVWALVAMIEGQYPRDAYPAVYASLLAIQRAQERSVALLREPVSPYEVDVLGITLEKGGASVLADGYLVAGTLSPAQEELLFGWGAFLQLADDLQDVSSDAHAGLATVFAQTARRLPLDPLSVRSAHLNERVLAGAAGIVVSAALPLVEMMQRSGQLLLLDAVGRARALHSASFAREAERRFPFRYPAIARARRRIARQRVSFMRLIERFSAVDTVPA